MVAPVSLVDLRVALLGDACHCLCRATNTNHNSSDGGAVVTHDSRQSNHVHSQSSDGGSNRARTVGNRAYLPLPYRHMAQSVGTVGLSAGLLSWLKFPKQTAVRPYGFTGATCNSGHAFVAHVRQRALRVSEAQTPSDPPLTVQHL